VKVKVEGPEAFDCDPGPLASPVEEEVEEDADIEGEEDEEDAQMVSGGVEIEHRIKVEKYAHPHTFTVAVACLSAAHTTCLVSLRVPHKTQQELTKTSIYLFLPTSPASPLLSVLSNGNKYSLRLRQLISPRLVQRQSGCSNVDSRMGRVGQVTCSVESETLSGSGLPYRLIVRNELCLPSPTHNASLPPRQSPLDWVPIYPGSELREREYDHEYPETPTDAIEGKMERVHFVPEHAEPVARKHCTQPSILQP
jgi:hypothetical protein